MYWAIFYEKLLLVQYAIQNGIDVNHPINTTYTPLTLAFEKYNLKIAQYLIENGADVIQSDQNRNMNEQLVTKMINANIVVNYMMENK